MTAELDRVLSEFMDAWNAGRRPDVDAYLERVAPDQRAQLADEIASFVTWAPTPDYDDDAWNAIASEPLVQQAIDAIDQPAGLWPALLPRMRQRAHLSVGQLAERLARVLGVEGREQKTAAYLAQMEEGTLDPRGVSRRVLDALASVLASTRAELEGAADIGFSPPRPSAAFFRADERVAEEVGPHLEVLADAMAAPSERDWDEVDELFRGGR